MNILIISSLLPYRELKYANIFVYQQAKKLAERGHKVWAIASHTDTRTEGNLEIIGRNKFDCIIGAFTYPLKTIYLAKYFGLKRAIGYVGLYRIARKILNKHKIDIIDGHWIGSGGVVSYLLKKPYIVTEHGLFCESIEKEGLSKKEIEFSKKVLNNAKLIITESFNLKDCIEKFTKNKVEVIHYGIDLSLFRPQKENIFKKPTFLSVGSLNKRKNHIDLLKAFKIVVYLGNDVNLVIIGRDEGEKENLKNFIKNNKLTKKVKIIDGVKNENLPLYYSSAVAFILPSLHEGFGIVFIEAMACGCPVIANNLYAVPEAVGNGGILVEPRNIKQLADAMERILIDKKLRKELSRKAIKQAKKFDIEKRIDKIEEIYQQYIKIYGNYMD